MNRKIIRLTESDLHNIVNNTLNRILQEDGLGGTSSFSVNSTAGGSSDPTGQAKNHIDAPAFGGNGKKKVGGNAFSEPIMRQAHNLGDVTQSKVKQVDMKPALKRGGSISVGESVRRMDEMIAEAVDEGIGNWLKGAALS